MMRAANSAASNTLRRMFAPLEGRIRMMVARAVVKLVDDAAKAQELQVGLLDGESQDAVERFQQYGFTGVPHPGAEALAVFVGGLRSHGVVIAVEDRRFRLTGLQSGEVALYDDLGQTMLLGRDGIAIESPFGVKVTAPVVELVSDDVRLGGAGGAAVARVGDDVDPMTHKIISGSDTVSAA